jgi:cell division protein FtsW (lipid II flippase)
VFLVANKLLNKNKIQLAFTLWSLILATTLLPVNRALAVPGVWMSDLIKNKTSTDGDNNEPKDISLDLKLMLVFHIFMMFLFMFTPIENPKSQAELAIALALILIVISVVHKLKSNWSWPGLSKTSIPSALFTVIFTFVFLTFASTGMSGKEFPNIDIENLEPLLIESFHTIINAASNPRFTPWYLGGLGIGLMNILTALNLATRKQSEFKAQCKNS